MVTRTDNRKVAHIWASGQGDARSNNSQLYNHGNTLFSYGAHYVAAYLVPGHYLPKSLQGEGWSSTTAVALFNDTKVSPTTGRHVSTAIQAFVSLPRHCVCGNVILVRVPDLTHFYMKELGQIRVSDDESQTKISQDFERILSSHFERFGQTVPSEFAAIYASDKAGV